MSDALEVIGERRDKLQLPAVPRRQRVREDRLDLAALLVVLRRRLGLFLSIWFACILVSVVITVWQTPLYTARSQLVLDLQQEQIAPKASQEASPQADRADTEVQVLQSRELAGRVAEGLQLARDPAFNPVKDKSGPRTWIARLLGHAPKSLPPPDLDSPAVQRLMTDRLLGALRVTRLGETRAVEIAITVASAVDAARIANEYARQYVGGQLRSKLDEQQIATRFLASRMDELRAQDRADTQRVHQYRIEHNLLSTSGASLTEQEISAYNQTVASARAQAAEDEARLNTALAQLRQGSKGDDVGESLNSSVVSGLRAKQAEVSGRLAELKARYGDNHPDIIKATSELADINNQIQAEIGRVISNLQAKRTVSLDRLRSVSSSLGAAQGALRQNNRALAGLDDLERRAQASQALYESYLNRYKETVAAGGTERADAKVISWAETPLAPSSPKPKLNVFLGVTIGLGAGLAAAFLAEMLFSGLTTGSEVEDRLSMAYLAGVPLLSSLSPRRPVLSSLSPRQRVAPEDAVTDAGSAFAESFRSLRTSLHYVSPDSPQVIAITSALPKEGKTTLAACLARSIALDGQRVIILDCDVVQAGLTRSMCGDIANAGLIQLLNGEASFDEVLMVDAMSGAHILPMSRSHRGPPGQLATKTLVDLIEELRDRYDQIVLDTAPVLPIASTRLVTAMADATILAARWRHTPVHAIRAARHLLPPNFVNVVGVVLTRINMKKQRSLGLGDPSYYYHSYKEYYA